MTKPQFTAWPAVCSACNQSGALVLCEDCNENLHICCGEHHECRCPYCGETTCGGQCEDKPGYYDSNGHWTKD